MKRRYLVLFILLLVLPTLGLIALYWIENWRGARAWEEVARELASRDETLDLPALVPPPIPDNQNFAVAPALIRALNEKSPPASGYTSGSWYNMPASRSGEQPTLGRDSWMAARPLPLEKWQHYYAKSKETPHPDQPGTPAADVLIALVEFAPLLDEVAREAEARQQSRIPFDWKQELALVNLLPQGSLYMRLTEALRLRASAELAGGQHTEAWRDTAAAFRLGAALGRQPLMIGFLLDYSCTTMAIQPVWEGLAERRWTLDELRRIQRALRQDDYLANYVRATRGDRAMLSSVLESLRESSANGERFFSGGYGKPTSPAQDIFAKAITVVPRGWVDQNKAIICRLYQSYIDVVDLRKRRVSLEKVATATAEVSALGDKPYLVYTLFARIGNSWSTVLIQRAARIQTACDQAEVACALECYYLDHLAYPDALDFLVPANLDRVPNDVMDGAPMRYQRTEDGRYRLYGVGWNGRDDGGTIAWQAGSSERSPSRPNDKEGDWVWQYMPMDPPAGMPW